MEEETSPPEPRRSLSTKDAQLIPWGAREYVEIQQRHLQGHTAYHMARAREAKAQSTTSEASPTPPTPVTPAKSPFRFTSDGMIAEDDIEVLKEINEFRAKRGLPPITE